MKMPVGFRSSGHVSSDLFSTTCLSCHNVTQCCVSAEVSCIHCSSVFTVLQDDDDSISEDFVASEDDDSSPPRERLEEQAICESEGEADISGNLKALKSALSGAVKSCLLSEMDNGSESILDVQVVAIEDINVITSDESLSESMHKYMAKVKVMTTLVLPIHVPNYEEMYEGRSGFAQEDFCEQAPQSYFFDFKCLKSDYNDGQIWVSYRCKDGMPRDFVQIRKVTSRKPFRVHVAILEPTDISSSNFSTCGNYRVNDELRIMDDIDVFSHMVTFEKVPNGLIRIAPVKGQVWALYKDWNKKKDYSGKVEYEMVKISAVKKHVVAVIPLVRYGGRCRRTVYIEQSSHMIFEVARENFIQFSHEIPVYKIQATNEIFKGCYELDSAAIPCQCFCD